MHCLILGITNSGKSNLAKRIAHDAIQRGESVVVYDPTRSRGWPGGARKFFEPVAFLRHMKTVKKAHVFIDEAKTLWEAARNEADALAYRGRHKGLMIYIIAQRAMMVPPNAREMCSHIYSFRQNGKSADILAEEYHRIFEGVGALPENAFYYTDGFRADRFMLDYSINPAWPVGEPPAIRHNPPEDNQSRHKLNL